LLILLTKNAFLVTLLHFLWGICLTFVILFFHPSPQSIPLAFAGFVLAVYVLYCKFASLNKKSTESHDGVLFVTIIQSNLFECVTESEFFNILLHAVSRFFAKEWDILLLFT